MKGQRIKWRKEREVREKKSKRKENLGVGEKENANEEQKAKYIEIFGQINVRLEERRWETDERKKEEEWWGQDFGFFW